MGDFLLSNKAGYSSAPFSAAPACPGGEWSAGSRPCQRCGGHCWAPTPPDGCHTPVPRSLPPAQALLSPGSCKDVYYLPFPTGSHSAPALRPGLSFELPRKPPLRGGACELEPSTPPDNADGASWALTPQKQPPANEKSTLEPPLGFFSSWKNTEKN